MASAAPPISDNDENEDNFDRLFQEFASGKTPPDLEADPNEVSPEGNDPEVQDGSAPAQAAAPPNDPPEDVTSGTADGGEQTPPAEQAPDPLAGFTPEQRALVEQLQRERDEARHKAQSDANRVAALSRKLAQQSSLAPGSATAPPKQEPTEAQKALDAKVKQLREDYGEIADPIIEMIEAQRGELEQVRSVVQTVNEERQAALIAAETRALEERHPDWRQVATSQEFANWLEVQPANIQSLASSWDARESSVALTLFKTEMAEANGQRSGAPVATAPAAPAATARRSQQLDAGRDVRSRPAPATSGPPEDFDSAFAYFEAQRAAKAKR